MKSVDIDFSHNWERPPLVQTTVHDIEHFGFDESADTRNPFNQNSYNYDQGFYSGEFDFDDPVTGMVFSGTPEIYGRRRIAAVITEAASQPNASSLTVLDLGAGTLDVARAIPSKLRRGVKMLNSDISGPWTELGSESSLTRGAKLLSEDTSPIGYLGLTNIQYDFNRTPWPFRGRLFSHVISSMALHHLQPQNKLPVLANIHGSLLPGGSLIVSDVYVPRRDRPMITHRGKRGPEECGGHPEAFGRFISRLQEVGFEVDDLAVRSAENETNYTSNDLARASDDILATLPVSNGVWFVVAKKPGSLLITDA